MRRLLLALILAAATAGAATLDVERPIAPARIGPSPGQYQVQAATDGRNFLIVWYDSRSLIPANVGGPSYLPMAQLVDPDGNVLATVSLPLWGTPVWLAGTYVVISGSRYIRISQEGAVIDATPRPFPAAKADTFASNGTSLLAVSQEQSGVLTATLLDGTLNVRSRAVIASDIGYLKVAAAANSNGFAVFYQGPVTPANWSVACLHAITLDNDGNVVNSSVVTTLPTDWNNLIEAASDGTNFLVVTTICAPTNTSGGCKQQFLVAGVARNGAVVGFTQFGPPDGYDLDTSNYALAATRGGYEIVFTPWINGNQGTVWAAPLNTTGSPGSMTLLFAPDVRPNKHVLLGNGQGPMMLLSGHGIPNNKELFAGELYGDVSDFAAHRDVSFRLGDGPSSQESLSAAVSGDGTALVVWRERTAAVGPLALYAARIAPDGIVLDRDSLLIGNNTADIMSPAVVSDGHDFLVAWLDSDTIVLRRVHADGRLGDPSSIYYLGAANSAAGLALAWNGSEFLLAFDEADYSPSYPANIETTKILRIDASGAPIGAPIAINGQAIVPITTPPTAPAELGVRATAARIGRP